VSTPTTEGCRDTTIAQWSRRPWGPLTAPERYTLDMSSHASTMLPDVRAHCGSRRRSPRALNGRSARGTETNRLRARATREAPLGPR
jgi:hypothetical protein